MIFVWLALFACSLSFLSLGYSSGPYLICSHEPVEKNLVSFSENRPKIVQTLAALMHF